MGLSWWQPQFIHADLVGSTKRTNTYPFSTNLDSFATLRRYIGDFWVHVENIHPPNEQIVAEGGFYWTLVLWPADGTFPPPGYLLGAGAITDNDRFIGFGYVPGELIYTNAFGAKTYRFPSGGGSIHLDVKAQRKHSPDPGNAPWVPWLSWDFRGANIGDFDGVTHVRIHAQFGFLMERP